MTRCAPIQLLALLVCSGSPGTVQAYQNPERFSATVDEGGGGERHFTGSAVDAYTCGVCHAPATRVDVRVYGLPDSVYEPGATYRVIVDWPDDLGRVALNLEMTDLAGAPLGAWIAPEPATLTAADRCSNPLSDTPTGSLLGAGPRTLVTMAECGQHQLSLDWKAPSWFDPLTGAPARNAWFSGSLVASNHDAKLSGDSVADFSRLLIVHGAPAVHSADVGVRCEVGRPGIANRPSRLAWPLLLLGLGRIAQRRATRR